MVPQGLDPVLLGRRICRLHRIKDKQRAGPPADLVVGKITDPIGRIAVGRHELASERHHPRRGLWRERVEPVKARAAPELEVDNGRQVQFLRWQGPAAGAVEPPGGEAAAGRLDPGLLARRERRPAVIDFAGLLAKRIAAVEGVDPKAQKRLTAGRHQPGDAVFRGQRPARRRRLGEVGAGRGAPHRQSRHDKGCERQARPAAEQPHYPPRCCRRSAVSFTRWCRRRSDRPSARSAGRRRPARSARPCRTCRCRGREPNRCRSS